MMLYIWHHHHNHHHHNHHHHDHFLGVDCLYAHSAFLLPWEWASLRFYLFMENFPSPHTFNPGYDGFLGLRFQHLLNYENFLPITRFPSCFPSCAHCSKLLLAFERRAFSCIIFLILNPTHAGRNLLLQVGSAFRWLRDENWTFNLHGFEGKIVSVENWVGYDEKWCICWWWRDNRCGWGKLV